MTIKIRNDLLYYDNENGTMRLRGILHCRDGHTSSAPSVIIFIPNSWPWVE